MKPKVKLANIEREPPLSVGLTEEKINDVKSLLKYFDSEGHTFFYRILHLDLKINEH